jgi:hypothetical protein
VKGKQACSRIFPKIENMNTMQRIFWLLLFTLIVFSACRKDINEVTTTVAPYIPPLLEKWEQPVVPVSGSLTGFVVDENGEPMSDADVILDGRSTKTDRFGHFFFKEANLNARGSLVQVNKAGYFPGSRRFFAAAGIENRVKIQLIPLQFDQSFSTAVGGNIMMNGNAYVTFQPNSIARADGEPYEGEVRVAAYWLDPDDERITDQMPGNLQGVDNQSQEVVLQTAGMMAVELQDEIGQPLNLLEGYTATIAMPVPEYLTGNAPSEIPNWSYNEPYGMWVEEGVSRLDNGYYIGEVSHFSYWNHDFKDPLVEFSAVFQNENGEPLENIKVVIREPGDGLYGFGLTGSDGSVAGLIPQNYDLLLEVKGFCGEVVYSESIGPFTNNADLGTITATTNDVSTPNITGSLVNCEGEPIVNGLVFYQSEGQSKYEYFENGSFSFNILTCTPISSATITGFDLDTELVSIPIGVTVSDNINEVGTIIVCSDTILTNIIRLEVDGNSAIYLNCRITYNEEFGGTVAVSPLDSSGGRAVHITVGGQDVGSYGGDTGNLLRINDSMRGWNITGATSSFLISQYGDIGENIIASFSGQLVNEGVDPPETVEIIGDFNIIRE